MGDAAAVKIKKEDVSPLDLLRRYFDAVCNSVHIINSCNMKFHLV